MNRKRIVVILLTAAVALGAAGTPDAGAAPEDAPTMNYNTPYRPQFHFSPYQGYMNDPNGLFYHDGIYHLFFQHYGFPHKSWGHATSTDLLQWTEHEDALVPEEGFQAFSGSAVVDYDNTSGLQDGPEPPIVALYTAWGDGQHLAYSTDAGKTWKRYGKVLELPNDEAKSFPMSARDPMVVWNEPTGRWVMILYQNFGADASGKAFAFYTSPDLKDWTYQSNLPGFYVCPDLFELPVEGEAGVSKWVILDWERDQCKYAIGHFDGKAFAIEDGPIRFVHGKRSHAATQTWKQGPEGDERLIQMVNLWRGTFPQERFENQMSVPLELKLRRTPEGIRLCRTPIREVQSLFADPSATGPFELKAKASREFSVGTRSFAVDAEVSIPEGGELTLEVLGHPITIRPDTIRFDGHTGKLPGTRVRTLQLLADITSVELFVNDGELVMLYLMDPPAAPQPVRWTAGEGSPVAIEKVVLHKVKSTWPGRGLRVSEMDSIRE